MSHHVSIATVFKSEQALIAALKDLGFNPEVHKTPQNLVGYYGQKETPCHIIVSKRQGLSADMGFQKQPDGSYKQVMDHMDSRRFSHLTQTYAKHVIKAEQARMGYRMVSEKTTAAGEIQMVLEVN